MAAAVAQGMAPTESAPAESSYGREISDEVRFLTGPLDDPLQLPSLSNFESFFLLKAFGTHATYYA
eukprot:COSAG06_NODE_1441_length_9454_cov_2.073437_2_plen_66_part_00